MCGTYLRFCRLYLCPQDASLRYCNSCITSWLFSPIYIIHIMHIRTTDGADRSNNPEVAIAVQCSHISHFIVHWFSRSALRLLCFPVRNSVTERSVGLITEQKPCCATGPTQPAWQDIQYNGLVPHSTLSAAPKGCLAESDLSGTL